MGKSALDLLNALEQTWLIEKIREAEQNTTGEIRVHLEDYSLDNALDRATEVFAELHMHDTSLRNGVLIYVAVQQHNFSIIGDMGINQYVDPTYWEHLINQLKDGFVKEDYYESLAIVIKQIGKLLDQHFPLDGDHNPNELSNEISFG